MAPQAQESIMSAWTFWAKPDVPQGLTISLLNEFEESSHVVSSLHKDVMARASLESTEF